MLVHVWPHQTLSFSLTWSWAEVEVDVATGLGIDKRCLKVNYLSSRDWKESVFEQRKMAEKFAALRSRCRKVIVAPIVGEKERIAREGVKPRKFLAKGKSAK